MLHELYDDAPSGRYNVNDESFVDVIRKNDSTYKFDENEVSELFDIMENLERVPNKLRPSTYLKRYQLTLSPVDYNFGQNTKTIRFDENSPKLALSCKKIVNEIMSDNGHEATNGCHITSYKDGEAGVGPHEDNEKVIDNSVPITSISFGCGRKFSFYRHQNNQERSAQLAKSKAKTPPGPKPVRIASIRLQDGDIIIMNNMQTINILHGIDKEPKITKRRLNLTFRKFTL